MADQYDQRADLRVIMAKILTFDLENSRFGVWVWGPRRLLRGFQFHPPSRKYSRMGRRRRAFLSDTGPLRLIAGSLTFPQNGALT